MERDDALSEFVQGLEGRLLCMQIAIRALILLHPQPTVAAKAVDDEIELWFASALGSDRTSSALLAGMEKARAALKPSPRDLAGPGLG